MTFFRTLLHLHFPILTAAILLFPQPEAAARDALRFDETRIRAVNLKWPGSDQVKCDNSRTSDGRNIPVISWGEPAPQSIELEIQSETPKLPPFDRALFALRLHVPEPLTVDTLDGTPIEEFGIRVMDQWKIGRKGKDDGAILIIALRDRAMRLEIGYGWEGDINDARAGDIIRGLAPFFRENRYTDGVLFAVGEVQRFVTGKAPENQPKAPARAVRRKQEQSRRRKPNSRKHRLHEKTSKLCLLYFLSEANTFSAIRGSCFPMEYRP